MVYTRYSQLNYLAKRDYERKQAKWKSFSVYCGTEAKPIMS